MNTPEYFLEDEIGLIAANIATRLSINLNYQFGYIEEIRETLAQDSKTKGFEAKKYPLLWMSQAKIKRGQLGWYGTMSPFSILLIQQSNKTDKYATRLENTFKPVLFPIYRELLNQLDISPNFIWGNNNLKNVDTLEHEYGKMPYWGPEQHKLINDVFDGMEITFSNLKISDNPNCTIFSNL